MLVTPLPGVDRQHLVQVLDTVGIGATNLLGAFVGKHPTDCTNIYLNWVHDAARSLRTLIRPPDIGELILTRRYEQILSVSALGTAAIYSLLAIEVEERIAAIDAARLALRTATQRWSQPALFVVADTSIYIHHPSKLDALDIAGTIGARGDSIHLLVPIVVVDELDALKQATKDSTRTRARQTLAVLDRVLEHPTQPGRLRDADFSAIEAGGIPQGAITVELVLDPPGHSRLPINDDELVDRILAIQPLTGRPVTLLTYDTGQSTRARAVGLQAVKLRQER